MILEHTAETTKTVIRQINPKNLSALRNWVAGALPGLRWRQSGLGMLQAYVLQGSEQEIRVHIWHPSIKLPGIDEAGFGHDHRFDMTSWVLVGRLTHVEVRTTPDDAGNWKMYEVMNARKALRKTGTLAGEFRSVVGKVKLVKHSMPISAGNVYFFPKRSFHETRPDSRIVVTIAVKTNQDECPARILCKLGREPINAFRDPASQKQCELILAEAKAMLCFAPGLGARRLQEKPFKVHRGNASILELLATPIA